MYIWSCRKTPDGTRLKIITLRHTAFLSILRYKYIHNTNRISIIINNNCVINVFRTLHEINQMVSAVAQVLSFISSMYNDIETYYMGLTSFIFYSEALNLLERWRTSALISSHGEKKDLEGRQCCQIGLKISSPKAHQNPPTSTKTSPKF